MLKSKLGRKLSPMPLSRRTSATLLSLSLMLTLSGCATLHGVPSKDRRMPAPSPVIMESVDYRELWLEKMRCLDVISDKPPKQSCETPPNE